MPYTVAEDADMLHIADRHGIDWRLLKALRETENGGPGREFGVLTVPAPTWHDQADVAARTIRHTLGRYWQHIKMDPWSERLDAYSPDFLRYFSAGGPGWTGYCPVHAENDPTGLNVHHVGNLTRFYEAACEETP